MSFDTFKNERGDSLYHVRLPEEIVGYPDYVKNVKTKEWFTYAASPTDAVGHMLHFEENICVRSRLYFDLIKKKYKIDDIASEIVRMEITNNNGKRILMKYPVLEKTAENGSLNHVSVLF